MFDDRAKALVRSLLYPVQFDDRPEEAVERVVTLVVGDGAMDASTEEYLEAINAALDSGERLSELIPQPHDEAVIRKYLTTVWHALTVGAVQA